MEHLHVCKQCGRDFRCECERPGYWLKGVCLDCVTKNSDMRQDQTKYVQGAFGWYIPK